MPAKSAKKSATAKSAKPKVAARPKAAPKSQTTARKTTAKPKATSTRTGTASKADGAAGVKAWLADVKPEHRAIVKRIDALVGSTIPGIQRHVKWRKPSQPLGVPFYGKPGQGWLVALWSFKDNVTVGFYAVGLEPTPPLGIVHGKGIRIHDASEFGEAQLRSWLEQSRELPGWGSGSKEFQGAR